MAKQKINPEEVIVDSLTLEAIPADAIVKQPILVNQSEITSTGLVPTDKRVLKTLQSYSDYATLYVDAQGGAYTADTPVVVRKHAKLYKNPFYESSNYNR